MKEPKLIALICAWGAELFIEPAIKQAIAYCDEVNVCIASHTEILQKYEDSTFEKCKPYNNSINLYASSKLKKDITSTKAGILNSMLSKSKCLEVGNWIWIIDVDEFYSNTTYNYIRSVLCNDALDMIRVEEYYFYINMQHYLTGSHGRLFRIKDVNNIFIPTQNYQGVKTAGQFRNFDTFPCMYHYGSLTSHKMRKEFWGVEYDNKNQSNKIEWLDNIYLNYDLNNQEYWSNKNKELFGIKSPWFDHSFKPNSDGLLYNYNGLHPSFVPRSLIDIEDYRLIYE